MEYAFDFNGRQHFLWDRRKSGYYAGLMSPVEAERP
jgi:hypothetical protein